MEFKKKDKIILLLFFGVLMAAMDISLIGPAIPAIEKSFFTSGHDISWIFSVYLLFHIFGIPLFSKLSDIHGRRAIYIASIAVFSIGSILVAVSNNLTLLLIGRAIQGFGSSGIFPVAAATIGDVFPVEKRGRALGLLGAVYGIAFIIGPVIAGSILHYFNWHIIFLFNLPIAIVLIFLSLKILPGKPQGEQPAINWKALGLLIIVLGSFTLGLNSIDVDHIAQSISSVSVLPFLLICVILTPVLILYERAQKNPFLNMDIFQSKQLKLVGLISFGLGLFQSSVVFLPKLAVLVFEVTPSKASFMLLPLVIATAIIPPLSGRLLDWIGSRIIVITLLVSASVALFILSIESKNIVLFYAAEVGLGFGLSVRASLKYILINETSAKDRATSLGMQLIFILVGQIAGASLIGIIISGSMGVSAGFSYAFLFLMGITTVLVAFSFFLKKRKFEIDRI